MVQAINLQISRPDYIQIQTLFRRWQTKQSKLTEMRLDGKSDSPLPSGGARVNACV